MDNPETQVTLGTRHRTKTNNKKPKIHHININNLSNTIDACLTARINNYIHVAHLWSNNINPLLHNIKINNI